MPKSNKLVLSISTQGTGLVRDLDVGGTSRGPPVCLGTTVLQAVSVCVCVARGPGLRGEGKGVLGGGRGVRRVGGGAWV